MTRPSWDDYYMVRAFWAARRSPDPATKHGCIFVGRHHEPLSEGYNGYPRGCDDERMPKTRPEKYLVTLHSEENAIFHAHGDLEGATAYITGPPCSNCWARMIQKGIKRVVIGPKASHCIDQMVAEATRLLLAGRDIEVIQWAPDKQSIKDNLAELAREIGLGGMVWQ